MMKLENPFPGMAPAGNAIETRSSRTRLCRLRKSILAVGTVALLGSAIAAGGQPESPGYHSAGEIAIGGEGGWDYLTVDSARHRLYVSHGDRVVVVDLDTDKVIGAITNTPGVHGLAVAGDLGHGLTTNGRENMASLIDLETLATLRKIPTGENPDGMLYEPGRHEFYTFNGRGQSATVIDARSGDVVATIPLQGRPESAAADPGANRVYDNIESKSEVAVIDTQTHSVTARWPIAPGEEASGMAIDLEHHRIFCGCRNERMVMLDTATGKRMGDVPIGRGVDANAFDPGTGLAFASCGDGTVTIAREVEPDKLVVVQTLKTAPGARTMALDPRTHRIYLSTGTFEAQPEAAPGERRRRPAVVPGSFKVLVYEPAAPAQTGLH